MSILSWMWAQIYDRNLQKAEVRCLREWRSGLLGNLSGKVLEIGSGTGLNLDYYPSNIEQLTLLEPDANMRKKLQQKIFLKQFSKIDILDSNAESIPQVDASYDAVVSTLVLCSVKNQDKVLSEIYRILSPQGKLIFIEHVAAVDNPGRFKWQRRWEPLWKKMTCGCRLTLSTETAIARAGFTFEEITRQSMRGVLPIARPSIKGVAIKNSVLI